MLNGLLAIAATLLAFLYPGSVELVELDVSLDVTFYSAAVHVDPVFLVWSDNVPSAAMTFGNTIVASRWLQTSEKLDWIMRYELNHVRQFQSLGCLMWPASLFVDMDPFRGEHPVPVEWDRPEQADEVMWLAPEWLPTLWHWLTLEVRFG